MLFYLHQIALRFMRIFEDSFYFKLYVAELLIFTFVTLNPGLEHFTRICYWASNNNPNFWETINNTPKCAQLEFVNSVRNSNFIQFSNFVVVFDAFGELSIGLFVIIVFNTIQKITNDSGEDGDNERWSSYKSMLSQ